MEFLKMMGALKMLTEFLCIAILNLGLPNANFACEYMETVVEAANTNDIRAELIVAMIYYESRWTPTARSKSNACGLMQVIPKYSGNRKKGIKNYTCKQLFNPITNIAVGTELLSRWVNKKYGHLKRGEAMGVCAYFAGYGGRCASRKPRKAGMRYSNKVRKLANRIKKEVNEAQKEHDLVKLDYSY